MSNDDAARYRWLRENLYAVDFDYGDEHAAVVVFRLPKGARVGAGPALDAAIDDAMAASQLRAAIETAIGGAT